MIQYKIEWCNVIILLTITKMKIIVMRIIIITKSSNKIKRKLKDLKGI